MNCWRLYKTKLKVRIGLFAFLFLVLTIVTTITSYANDEVSGEKNVSEIGAISNDEIVVEDGNDSAGMSVKRSQIRVKVVDELDSNVSDLAKVSIKGTNYTGEYENGYIIFDTIPSGNYEVVLESLPDGLSISSEQSNAKVMLNNDDNNVVEYQFKVKGTYTEELLPNIQANLLSVTPSVASNGQEIDVTYQIKAESFDSLAVSDSGIDEAVIIFDLSSDVSLHTKYDAVRRSIVNCLITDEQLIKNNFGLSIIGYNETAVFPTLNNINYKRTFDLGISEENKIIRDLIEQPYIYNQGWVDKNKTRVIDDALEEADKILSLNQDKKKKSIIIISNENIKYSDSVVSKIKDKGYEIISLNLGQGYQSADNSTKLRELHEKLGGKESYFEVPTPATIGWGSYSNFDNELNLIRDLLVGKQQSGKSSLSIKADLNFDLGNHFLPVSGLTWIEDTTYQLEIPTINYNPTTQNSDGTYKYEAEELEVSFKIKLNTEQLGEVTFANREDKNYNNISYTQFDGKEVLKLIETPKVEGVDTEELLPNIQANLLSVNPSVASNGQEIDVTYQITPQEFDALFSGGNEEFKQIKEAMFVVDASGHMTQNGWNNAVKNGLTNQITQYSEIIEREFKMGIVGYNDTAVFPNNDSSKVGLYNLGNNDDRNNFRRIVQEDQLRYEWNNMSTKIDDALIKADDILSSSGTNNGKAIVIIAAGNIEVSQSTVEKIQSKGYKIISFYVGNNSAVAQGTYHLRDLHTALGGKEDYFETPYEGGNYNFANRDLEKVREALLTDISSPTTTNYEVTPTLNFDLGNHFLPVSGLTWIKDTSYQLEIPTINYNPTTQNSDGTYKYEAEAFEVSFKIKLNTEQLGEVTFANREDKFYNNITYTQFDGKDVIKLIETPKVEVIAMPIEISHGLYGGINEDKTNVDIIPSVVTTDGQDLRKTFVASSTINFAGLVSYHPNLREITLYTDQRLNINSDKIEVYKVMISQNGKIKLEKLRDVKMTSSEIDNYKKVLFTLPEGLADTSSLLIRYSTLAPDINEGTFKNAIVAGTESEVVEVKTISEKNPDHSNLPNLF